MTGQTIKRLTIAAIRVETHDTKSFVLKEEQGKIIYDPGQFLTLVFPDRINEKRRSYSISSNQAFGEPLTITVKRVDNGEFSRFLFDQCRVGDPLFTTGASGFFTLPKDASAQRAFVFYAAGSGISPILPLIRTLLAFHPAVQVKLVYSNPSRRSAIFHDRLVELEEQHSGRFTIEWFFSDAQNLLGARLTKQTVAQQVEALRGEVKGSTLFYMCGPLEYMRMIEITLLREAIDRQRIRREIFDTVKPVVKEVPSDTRPHNVKITLEGNQYDLTVEYPVTILQSAKKKGIVLPYSCEAGKCGTCAATCRQGSIWMSTNEVLLDKELQQGRVLTCTGYPVGGDAWLDFPPLSRE